MALARLVCTHFHKQAGKLHFVIIAVQRTPSGWQRKTGAMAIQCDLTKREQVEQCVAQIRKSLGTIGAVVCNAGVAQQKMFCDLTDADWDFVMDSNLRSVFYTIQAALPDLVREKEGAIVTVSSVWGQTGASCEAIMPHQKQD